MALYAFDGTGDDDRGMGADEQALGGETNVWKFLQGYDAPIAGPASKVYKEGLGTRLGAIGTAVGGAFGAGWISRLDEAYDTLCGNYLAGDHDIDVVGFSRGSSLALGFVNKIHDQGIKRGNAVVAEHPAIRFLGLFDVVAAFGPAALGGPFAHIQPLHKLTLPPSVAHCYHAMSLDERRFSFDVTRVPGAYEVWFRGVHCDIGGSNKNPGLSNITLRWMYHKAQLCDVPVTKALEAVGRCEPTDAINPALACRAEKVFWRKTRPGDLIHYTVSQHTARPGEACNPHLPEKALIEDSESEAKRRDPPKRD